MSRADKGVHSVAGARGQGRLPEVGAGVLVQGHAGRWCSWKSGEEQAGEEPEGNRAAHPPLSIREQTSGSLSE